MPPKIDVTVVDVRPIPYSLVPNLGFNLEVRNTAGEQVSSCSLLCDVFMKVTESGQKRDFFWGTIPIYVQSAIPAGQSIQCLGRLECTYDVDLSLNRYLSVIGDEIPLKLVFHGTITWGTASGIVTDIEKEYALPSSRWKKMVLEYYKDIRWIAVRRDTLDHIKKIIDEKQLHTHDEAIQALMKESNK